MSRSRGLFAVTVQPYTALDHYIMYRPEKLCDRCLSWAEVELSPVLASSMRRVYSPTTHDGPDQLLRNAADGLEVLICHDAPAATTGLVSGLPWEMPTGLRREADSVQRLLQAAVDATEPSLVFHGHCTNRTAVASPTAARSSGSPATDTPQARPCCRSATCKPATWTRYSARSTGSSPTGDATTDEPGAIADRDFELL